ncbi:hypothetical protein [Streptomyces sp. AC495_CC817]|uniref:hypothetical protein n=1 Tax=Streptomyces sp. AC495_CC817 TaxID=2823900 RepID=UPI001C26A72A|nr:hypothetical protein [Streptomyces sp. AC495_CC817]
MTTTDLSASRAPVEGARPNSRVARRALLDVSIDDELLRGELRGTHLSVRLRNDLAVLVEREIRGEDALSERAFLEAASGAGVLTARRRARRLEALVSMSLARRDGADVRATVAGIAAVRRPSQGREDALPARSTLRALRLAEIDGIRR